MGKKIIASGKYWICENMDNLSPIIEEGNEYLLSDGSRVKIPYGKEDSRLKDLEWASEEEIKNYASANYGYIFKGDKVVIKRGRKYLNEEKIVKGYYRFDVAGTYGKVYTDYLMFTDGTKCNLQHCDKIGIEHKIWEYQGRKYSTRQYAETFNKYMIFVGGRY